MMPEAGGDYVYLRRAYGRLVGFLYRLDGLHGGAGRIRRRRWRWASRYS